MCCFFPSKKSSIKSVKPREINIKPKKDTWISPLFEGNSPKHEPIDKRVHVLVDSILLRDSSPTQIISTIKK